MKIAVIGTGYVGLVVGACFAETGNDVICVDKDRQKIAMLRRGQIPIYEPGLEEIVRRNRQEKRLAFTTTLPDAVRKSDVVFIAVGTPTGEDGSADLQHVLERGARDRPRDERLQGHRRQEHGAGGHVGARAADDSARDDAPVQRREQPGVPEAGRGGRRLPEAGSRRDRRRPTHGRPRS